MLELNQRLELTLKPAWNGRESLRRLRFEKDLPRRLRLRDLKRWRNLEREETLRQRERTRTTTQQESIWSTSLWFELQLPSWSSSFQNQGSRGAGKLLTLRQGRMKTCYKNVGSSFHDPSVIRRSFSAKPKCFTWFSVRFPSFPNSIN